MCCVPMDSYYGYYGLWTMVPMDSYTVFTGQHADKEENINLIWLRTNLSYRIESVMYAHILFPEGTCRFLRFF